jgi:hypothetical protein
MSASVCPSFTILTATVQQEEEEEEGGLVLGARRPFLIDNWFLHKTHF